MQKGFFFFFKLSIQQDCKSLDKDEEEIGKLWDLVFTIP